MRILSDGIDAVRKLAGFDLELQEVSAACLTDLDLKLWHALAGGERVWSATCVTEANWARLAVIDNAACSQLTAASELALDPRHLTGGLAMLALTGQNFFGQRGRPWVSPRGNLYLTAAVPLDLPAREAVPALMMLPSVAVCRAIERVSAGCLRPGIKWVNDVLVRGRKVGGVIIRSETRGDRVVSAVFGIGVNVATAPKVEPTPFVPAVDSLSQAAGVDIALGPFLWALLAALSAEIEILTHLDFGAIAAAYRSWSAVVGRRVQIWDESVECPRSSDRPKIEGEVLGIDDDLRLRISGHDKWVAKGRLVLFDG